MKMLTGCISASSCIRRTPRRPRTLAISCGSWNIVVVPCGITARGEFGGRQHAGSRYACARRRGRGSGNWPVASMTSRVRARCNGWRRARHRRSARRLWRPASRGAPRAMCTLTTWPPRMTRSAGARPAATATRRGMASDQGFNAVFSMAHRVTGGVGTASGVGGSLAMQDMRSSLPELVYYPDTEPGIRRRRAGGSATMRPDGSLIRDPGERSRIASLAVPPAYEEVVDLSLAARALAGHRPRCAGGKQYRYHPRWTEFRAQLKYGDLGEFGRMLPRIRRRIARDLAGEPGSGRSRWPPCWR